VAASGGFHVDTVGCDGAGFASSRHGKKMDRQWLTTHALAVSLSVVPTVLCYHTVDIIVWTKMSSNNKMR
jgi:hypothetical protein